MAALILVILGACLLVANIRIKKLAKRVDACENHCDDLDRYAEGLADSCNRLSRRAMGLDGDE